MKKGVLTNISWRAWRVWQRNFDVYRATWKVNFIPPLMEPVLYLFSFGIGLGELIKEVPFGRGMVPYFDYIAPGLIAVSVMNHGFFETTYASFVRMYYQKTFDAILSTPLSVEDVIAGEMFWGATKAFWAGVIMMGVAGGFGLLRFPQSLWILPVLCLGGVVFSCLGMCFTGVVKNIEMFNFPVFLFITPMFLFSGVFFPIQGLPFWAQVVAQCLPLTWLSSLLRHLARGEWSPHIVTWILLLIGSGAVFAAAGIVLMRKRLLR